MDSVDEKIVNEWLDKKGIKGKFRKELKKKIDRVLRKGVNRECRF